MIMLGVSSTVRVISIMQLHWELNMMHLDDGHLQALKVPCIMNHLKASLKVSRVHLPDLLESDFRLGACIKHHALANVKGISLVNLTC